MKRIGIIGGSGLTNFDELVVQEKQLSDTAWGQPSSPLLIGSFQCFGSDDQSSDVVFVSRHGEHHQIPPHKVNYRANIAALRDQQVSAIYAVNVVGGINMEMCPGDLVIPDQIVDYTWGREHTYFDGCDRNGAEGRSMPLQHVDFTRPYDEALRYNLLHRAIKLGFQVHSGGVYGATQGPRLETAAEILRMRQDGCDVVGMTGMPEAALARELGIPYASVALVVNMAAGLGDKEITLKQIEQIIHQRMVHVRQLLMSIAIRD